VRIIKSLQVLLVVTTAVGMSEAIVSEAIVSKAMAQGRPSVSLFGAAAVDAPQGEIRGMRPETVGEVAYFSLAIDAPSKLRGLADAPQQVKIALPGGSSVTCMLRSQARPGGMLLLSGAPEDGAPGQRCSLVVENGQVTGELELETGRYRIQPLGNGPTHVVVEVKTAAFPSENEPKSEPKNEPKNEPKSGPTSPSTSAPR
jgi:hypothetical protein